MSDAEREWKEAIPVAYGREEPGCGMFNAEVTGPPLMVRPFDPSTCDKNKSMICIEFIDDVKIATNQLFGTNHDISLRLALHPHSARWLATHLIRNLAEMGDAVCVPLWDELMRILEEIKEKDPNVTDSLGD